MDTIRESLGRLFTRSYAADTTGGRHTAEAIEEELKRKDVLDLMQQQHQQDQQQDQDQEQKGKQQPQDTKPRIIPKGEADTRNVRTNVYEVTTANLPAKRDLARSLMAEPAPINYEMEFVDFINRNTPPGFGNKLQQMLPYLGVSFIAWPTYWMWRGFHWQSRRGSERIGMYIQRTFQHAKLMQVAILSLGLIMATTTQSGTEQLDVHEVSYNSRKK
ncbi:uncharacterized protein LOC6581427 [Drosophila mojavensis]|uniref:Uncharacterized protein n=1 Tax=Drosophila mojavensis TaxID=7230 RepID=B4KXW1_DROMO|nr:uncharacterized protein LOC6581427 [Drosophila mojavensis]EDW17633.1 uncharacterized protein Dmoj_GI12537 [Drosophila mojavensis]